MKKVFLTLFICCFTLVLTAQSDRSIRQNEWILSFGLNTVNSLGTKSPFKDPGDWAFQFPITAGIETKWARLFSFEATLSLNGFKANTPVDNGPPADNLTYISIDSALKYYFGEFLLPRTEWLDFYGSAGLGMFIIDDANLSFNIGGGVMFWINKSRGGTFGIRAQGLGKFAVNHSNSGQVYPNNHFQYSLTAIFKI